MTSDDMESYVKQANLRLPSRSLSDTPAMYHLKLVEVHGPWWIPSINPFVFFSLCLFSPLWCRLCCWICCCWKNIITARLLAPGSLEWLLDICRQHYIEYLVNLINQHKIDPLPVFDGSELIAQLTVVIQTKHLIDVFQIPQLIRSAAQTAYCMLHFCPLLKRITIQSLRPVQQFFQEINSFFSFCFRQVIQEKMPLD